MALICGVTAVGTAAARIFDPTNQPIQVKIQNLDNTDEIHLGCANVTSLTGYGLQKLDNFDIVLQPGNTLWAIAGKAGHNLGWIKQEL